MKYFLNIYRILVDLLPWFIKRDDAVTWSNGADNWAYNSNTWAWIQSSSAASYFYVILRGGIGKLNDLFRSFITTTLYDVHITGQVLYLEKLLNDKFDAVFRRIYIIDANVLLPPNVFSVTDNEAPLYIYSTTDNAAPLYIYQDSEYYTFPNFIVKVPFDRLNKSNEIKAYVNKYKLAATKYMIMGHGDIPPDTMVLDNG